jgi:thioredoxin 2
MPQSPNTISYVCPACNQVNRVPESRITEHPVCGNCKRSLIQDHPIELTDANFQKFVARTSVLVIVDFWAAWCAPCRMMAPGFAAAAKQLAPQIVLAKLDTEASRQTAAGFEISGIPCLIAFRNGREVTRRSGVMGAEQIAQWARAI